MATPSIHAPKLSDEKMTLRQFVTHKFIQTLSWQQRENLRSVLAFTGSACALERELDATEDDAEKPLSSEVEIGGCLISKEHYDKLNSLAQLTGQEMNDLHSEVLCETIETLVEARLEVIQERAAAATA